MRVINILTVALVFILFSSDAYSITLIDNIEIQEYSYQRQMDLTEATKVNELPYNEVIQEIDETSYWRGVNLNSDYKYLISKDFMHVYTNLDVYLYSYHYDKDTNTLSKFKEERFYIEPDVYKQSGFDGLPDIHVSLISNNSSYINQLDNSIYPTSSCVASSLNMFLRLNNIDKYGTDELIEKLGTTSVGARITELESFLRYIECYNYRNDSISKDSLKSYIDNGKFLFINVCSNTIDHLSITNRRYTFKEDTLTSKIYHCMLTTGYITSGDKLYLEIYDPFSYENNQEGIPEGKGIYLSYDEFKAVVDGKCTTLVAKFDKT